MKMNDNAVVVLHAVARAGKDTLARALQVAGYTPLALGAPLYAEVAAAFGVREHELRNADKKDTARIGLALRQCGDPVYVRRMEELGHDDLSTPRSPRWHLDRWGTEYRRHQNHNYWGEKLIDLCKDVEGPIVLTDMRIDDYEIAQTIAADRGAELIVFGITRPDSPHEISSHSSTKLWPAERMTYQLVNVEDDPEFMIRDAIAALEGKYAGTTHSPTRTQGEILLLHRENLRSLWEAALTQQDRLNAVLDEDWKVGGKPYFKAFAKEASEIMDHQGWEWWKPAKASRQQVVVELADMLCFGLSHCIATGQEDAALRKFLGSHIPLAEAASDVEQDIAIGDVIQAALATRSIPWIEYGKLLNRLGVSRFEVLKAFFAKVALNHFRWANGYREGAYVKMWTDGDGARREDNEFLWGYIGEWEEVDATSMYEAMIAGTFTDSLLAGMQAAYEKYGK